MKFLKNLKIFIVCLALFSWMFLPLIKVRAATTSSKHHVGYFYYGYNTGNTLPQGLRAEIYLVTNDIPFWTGDWYAEWISVITRYTPTYWVQKGYHRHYNIWGFLVSVYYAEEYDEGGHTLEYLGAAIYLWNDFRLVKGSHNRWEAIIYYFSNNQWHFHKSYTLYISPNDAIDYQAMVETTTTSINIDGSHFRKLRYLYGGTTWSYWSRHEADPYTDPYYIDEIKHYEFKAYGGG
ncbi:MAG: exported protein of unknown function [Promethearchaeota archaeon]|nr:MAG: exported protein of unknown function [Candidatus Lokiarchaeota archaeon]